MQPILVRYSSIAAFKACPNRYRLAFVEGLVPEREPATTRIGSNWHAMHECWAEAVAKWVPINEDETHAPEDARKEHAWAAVYELLNQRYAEVPAWLTADEWALERQILLVSLQAYQWYFQNDPIEFLASEVVFRLPLHNPKLGLPLPMTEVQREGHIDHLIRYNGGVMALERKSTSKSLAPDSDFWQRWTKDDQISMYALAMRDLAGSDSLDLPEDVGNCRWGSTLLDCWHKPSIKPATLTQAETKAFTEMGEYCGQAFTVSSGGDGVILVDGQPVLIEQGKRGFTIRETIEMFGARLLQEYHANPTRYFVRREIARTDAEIGEFQASLWAVYQTQASMRRSSNWYGNYSQCRATFACPFIPICFGPGADAVSDGTTTPSGFKRQKFVDLTIKGEVPMEQE